MAVVGLGVSNLPVARLMMAGGARVHLFDQRPAEDLDSSISGLLEAGAEACLGPDYLEGLARGSFDVLVLTPGLKKDITAVEVHRQRGSEITSEMDLFLRLNSCRTLGITGSAGKTTTTTLVGEILQLSGSRVMKGGNIGTPMIQVASQLPPEVWAVLEMSSFQLETCTSSPHVAVLLNLYRDHLDVHADRRAYWAAKKRIMRFQEASDFLVLNQDQPEVSALAAEASAEVCFFSTSGLPCRGVGLEAGHIVWVDGRKRQLVGPVSEIKLRGRHNQANFLAATAASILAGASPDHIMEVGRTFSGVPHRLEEIRRLDGVLYVNDSIATTPERARAALAAYSRPVVMIAGGYDKGLSYGQLGEDIARRAKALVLMGDTAETIRQSVAGAGGTLPMTDVSSMEEAVSRARRQAEPGDVILMSPACASFDMFRSYVHRGDVFRQIVLNLAPAEMSS